VFRACSAPPSSSAASGWLCPCDSGSLFCALAEGRGERRGRDYLPIQTRSRRPPGCGDDAFYMAAEGSELVLSALKLNLGHAVLCGQVFQRIFCNLNFRLYPQTDVFLMGAQSFLVRFAAREA